MFCVDRGDADMPLVIDAQQVIFAIQGSGSFPVVTEYTPIALSMFMNPISPRNN